MKFLAWILIFSIPLIACSQNHLGDSWEIGSWGYSISFKQIPISHDTLLNTNHFFSWGKSCICDDNGDLLIMSSGYDIMNKNGQIIENGDTMTYKEIYDFYSSNNCPQNSILLPKDTNSTFYFVRADCNDTCFTNQWLAGNYKSPFNVLNYSVVDMNANGGLGKVTQKMIPVLVNQDMSKAGMMACRHGNGKDWWLIKAATDSNNFFLFQLTPDSVVYKGIQRLPAYNKGYYDVLGQMVFNPTGDQFAFVGSGNNSKLCLYDFDRCYGKLSNFRLLDVPIVASPASNDTIPTGVAFSPNGRFIYVTKWSFIFQYDTQDSTWYQVADADTSWSNFAGYNTCLLGPDQKIYIGYYHGFCKEFSVVDSPDNKGAACNFCRKCLRSKSIYGYFITPPCMPNYNLGAKICWPDGVSEAANSSFAVIPNPSTGRITVKGDDYLKEIKYIFDATGNLIQTTRHNNIDLGSLPKGVYFLKCREKTTKVLIQ